MKALDVAMYVITRCVQKDKPISNLQLQKILYFIQVAFLQRYGQVCFDDEFEAWKLGPVVRDVYNQYCYYGSFKLRQQYTDVNIPLGFEEISLLNEVIDLKSQKTARQLVQESHEPGRAWARVFRNGEGLYDIIDRNLIKAYG